MTRRGVPGMMAQLEDIMSKQSGLIERLTSELLLHDALDEDERRVFEKTQEKKENRTVAERLGSIIQQQAKIIRGLAEELNSFNALSEEDYAVIAEITKERRALQREEILL